MFNSSKKIIFLGFILVLVLVNLSSAHTIYGQATSTQATSTLPQTISDEETTVSQSLVGNFVSTAIKWAITIVVKPLIGGILFLGTHLIKFAININIGLFSAPYINNAWQNVRDIANLGFILAIIVIAFATILRIEAYGVKKTLAKLIIVALLINFSLMICAGIFDFSNIFSKTLISSLKTDALSKTIIKAIGLQKDDVTKSYEVFSDSSKSLEEIAPGSSKAAGDGTIGAILSPIFVIIFSVILAITLLAIFVMLMVRYVILGVLIVLSPLAWLCAILPATETYWKQWWSQFIRWIIFAPLMLFFIWLAFYSGTTPTGANNLMPLPSSTGGAALGGSIGPLFIITGILLMGLFIANSLGMAGSSTFMAWGVGAAAAIGGGVGSFAGGWAKYGGARATRGLRENLGDQLAKTGKEGSKFTRWISQPIRKTGERMFYGAYGEKLAKQAGTLKKPSTLAESISGQMKYHFTDKKGKKDLANIIKGLTPKIKT